MKDKRTYLTTFTMKGEFIMMENRTGYTPKTPAQFEELLNRAKAGDISARNELVVSNTGLVKKFALKFIGRGLDYEDLCQEGCLGLIHAVDKYDMSEGTAFSTYAYYWIIQSICRAICNTGNTIRIPVYVHNRCSRTSRKIIEATDMWGSAISDEDLSRFFDISTDEIKELRKYEMLANTTSLNAPIKTDNDDSDISMIDLIPSDLPSPHEIVERAVIDDALLQAVSRLSEREQYVLSHRYGLMGLDTQTLDQIGKRLGLTRERIRQIENKSLEKLQNNPILRQYADIA